MRLANCSHARVLYSFSAQRRAQYRTYETRAHDRHVHACTVMTRRRRSLKLRNKFWHAHTCGPTKAMPMIPILALATLCTTLTILRLVAGTAGSWHASQGALAGSTNLSRLEYGNLETTSSSTLVHAPDEASIFTTISASGNEGESVAVTRSSSAAATSAAYTAGKAQGWRSLFASDGDGATAVPVTAPTHAPTVRRAQFKAVQALA